MTLKKYKTLIFDCDGVVLDSNAIKSDSFYEVVLPYGKDIAEIFVNYHKSKGGVSRFDKFQYFFEYILGKKGFQIELEELLKQYSKLVKTKLLQCSETEGLRLFISKISEHFRKIIVSGGMQSEVREVFAERKLDIYFDGIYGSPDSKETILKRETEQEIIIQPAIFFGDTKYDYECANQFNLDFVFMYGYSEFKNWKDYFSDKNILCIKNLHELIEFL